MLLLSTLVPASMVKHDGGAVKPLGWAQHPSLGLGRER